MSKSNSDKSAGSDGMLPKLVKQCCQDLSTSLLTIINKSLREEIFTDKLKIAKVIAIFKQNEPFLAGNYRPISLKSSLIAVSARF